MADFRCEPLSDAAVEWLQSLLRERFTPELRLCREGIGSYAIRIDTAPGSIVVGDPAVECVPAAGDAPCATWDAAGEGWQTALPGALPAPGCSSLPSPLVEVTSAGQRLRYDAIGFAYFMLSRSEEIGLPQRDAHGRFPAEASNAFRRNYLRRPIVDEWLHVLGQLLLKQWPRLALKQARFRTLPSHDVDFPSRYAMRSGRSYVRTVAADLIRRHRYLDAIRSPWIRWSSARSLRSSDPSNTFDWLMETSERHSLRSAFYFMCGRTNAKLDGGYEIEQPPMLELLRKIHLRGHEIGLHPSYDTFLRPDALIAEADRLRKTCHANAIEQCEFGGRMHYLRWSNPETLQAWERAGMAYDSTLGYADHAGFRSGTCHEYTAFDPVAKCALKLRLRPLVAMECTVIDPTYMGLGTGAAAFDAFAGLKQACRAVNGSFTLLWHNSELDSPASRDLYESVVSH